VATVPTQLNASSDVWPGGQILFTVQFETYVNSGQPCAASGVTIGIAASTAPTGGTGTPLEATAEGIASAGTQGLFSYTWSPAADTAPGDYLVTWSGVRASDSMAITYVQACTVAEIPAPTPTPGVYATYGDYQNETGDLSTPAQIVNPVLRKASMDVDRACIAAVYRTDADGMPQDAVVQNTLMRATCMQAEWRLAHMDPTGIKFGFSSTNVGGVSVTRAAQMTGLAFFPIGPDALTILHVNGILPSAPLVNW